MQRQPDPSPQEIEERCRKIRETWTPEEHLERAGFLSTWTVPGAKPAPPRRKLAG